MLRIRLALEPMAAGLAAERITRRRARRQSRRSTSGWPSCLRADAFAEAFEADSEFHLSIYDAAGQPLLRSMIAQPAAARGPDAGRGCSRDYRKSLVGYNHHRRILAALRAGDAEAARTRRWPPT